MRNSIDKLYRYLWQNIQLSPERKPLDFTVGERHTHRHHHIEAHLRRLMMMQQQEVNSVGGQLVAGS